MTGTIVSSPSAGENHALPVPPLLTDGPVEQVKDSSDSALSELGSRGRWFDDPRIPAWLVSTIVHLIALLVLALLTYRGSDSDDGITLKSRRGAPSPVAAFQVAKQSAKDQVRDDATAEAPVDVNIKLKRNESAISAPAASNRQTPSLTRSQIDLVASGGSDHNKTLMRLPGGGLAGRTPEGRIKYGERYGATGPSEIAVELALKWLADHQRPDGSWSFNLHLEPCEGRCKNSKKAGDTPTPATGATGLALLAFLGAGYTHQTGPYAETVRRGIYYLRAVGGESEFGLDWQQGSMYGHGIAVMALSEALTMSTTEDGMYDSDLRRLVQRGADFTESAQHSSGSWGYVPGSPGDTTLTGWQVLSLVAARRNGILLETNTLPKAKKYLLQVAGDDRYEFGYKGPPAEPTTTAIGLTLLLYLGEDPRVTMIDRSFDRLAERGPTLTNVYHDYYGTLALHHSRHHDWDHWNSKLRDHLVGTQSKDGHQRGSWHFKDRWGDIGGRLYTTCMCTMILEVYYRYLPLYEEIEDFPL